MQIFSASIVIVRGELLVGTLLAFVACKSLLLCLFGAEG